MAGPPDDPLSEMGWGVLTAWGLVWGSLAALVGGIALGWLAAGGIPPGVGWLLVMTLAFPIVAFISWTAFVISLGMLIALVRFVVVEERRLEALLAPCGLAGLQTFTVMGGFGSLDSLCDWLRVPAVAAVLPGFYAAVRLYARRRLRRPERSLKEGTDDMRDADDGQCNPG